jgi:PAS domain S-box-containing protein
MLQATAPNTLANPLLQLADAMPQLVFMSDAQGEVTYFNSRINEYSGARRRTDGVWEWQDIIHPDDLGETGLTWMHSVATGQPYESEHRMKMADGTYCWHLTRALPQRDCKGTVTHWFGTSTNINQQKLAQQTVRESEERFRILTNTIPQIVWIVDADGKTEFVNHRWNNYTAQSPEEASSTGGRAAMIHPDDLPLVMDSWKIAMQQGIPAEWEYRLRQQETGRYTWFKGRVQPIKDEEGNILKWIGASTDIQALKDTAGLLEQQVAERTRALQDLNLTLHRQTGALQRSNDDLQQFAHVASHDLKEPLRKIRTFVSRLAHESGGDLPGRGLEYLEKIERSASRMSEMIDGVLHYSVVDNVEEQQLKPVDLQEILTNVQSDLELLIQKQSAEVRCAGLPCVTGVPVLLHQLLQNLVNNALKFSRPGSTPVISIESRTASAAEIKAQTLNPGRAYAVITVKDNGIGFDPAFSENIFKTFSRLHPKDRYEGTGLGLALCQKIVHRHGGTIGAEGRPDNGATFTVFLPLAGHN